jgi:hypothetical protein
MMCNTMQPKHWVLLWPAYKSYSIGLADIFHLWLPQSRETRVHLQGGEMFDSITQIDLQNDLTSFDFLVA